jgi:hypothetical protein
MNEHLYSLASPSPMAAPAVNVNSYSYLIQLGWMQRLKLIPPFSTAAKFGLTTAKITQAEHIPYVGVFFVNERFSSDGDANHAEPRFVHSLDLGFSYLIQNNDPDTAQELLDAAHWSFMKLLHDPSWHTFTFNEQDIVIEAITSGNHHRIYGTGGRDNETPVAEMRQEMTYTFRTYFEPIISDVFEVMHTRVIVPWPEDPARQPIIREWVLPTPPVPIITQLSYDYQKPVDPIVPAEGAVTHPNEASSTMRIAKVGQGGQDNSALLATLRPGDQLTLGGITWTVMGIADEPTSVHISVVPITQHSPTGIQEFTLATGVLPPGEHP